MGNCYELSREPRLIKLSATSGDHIPRGRIAIANWWTSQGKKARQTFGDQFAGSFFIRSIAGQLPVFHRVHYVVVSSCAMFTSVFIDTRRRSQVLPTPTDRYASENKPINQFYHHDPRFRKLQRI